MSLLLYQDSCLPIIFPYEYFRSEDACHTKTVHVRRHVQSHMRVSTHVQNPQHERKYHPCQHHYQPCNRTCQIGTSVATTILVTVTFCFRNSALSCFILIDTFDMLHQQEVLYCRYTNLELLMQFQISKSNRSCRRGCSRIDVRAPISSGYGLQRIAGRKNSLYQSPFAVLC